MNDRASYRIAQRLHSLSELSVELGGMHDTDALLERIVRAARETTEADGVTLYRPSSDGRALCFSTLINDSLGICEGGAAGGTVQIEPVALFNADGSQNTETVAAYAANRRESVNIEDVYESALFNFSGMHAFDRSFGYRSVSFLTVPMCNHDDELVGVLQLINARDRASGATRPFTATDQRFVEALAAQAAMALSKQQMLAQMDRLLEALVNLINIGIDTKSPYTGRHCQLVPRLTMMIAEAAHAADSGPLAGFRMSDEDRRELWLAGLLHDCGKITTPVHVVDKATKLQTIFDRIALVDTRFEVLLRDAEIRALRAVGARDADAAAVKQALARELRGLRADRDFLRHANIGSEGMSPDDEARVRRIAAYRWTGPDGVERDFLDEDEVRNLTVRFGTLNDDERKIINNHIVVTIRMLESLPWPRHLKNVPEYAGGHHERMDGKGYPRGLSGSQMSVQARVMAIADIFEALTAGDRPYKKAKSLSESLHILGKFALNGHIDPDLFDIFVRNKVYLAFAREHMDPHQVDAVDEALIPGYQP